MALAPIAWRPRVPSWRPVFAGCRGITPRGMKCSLITRTNVTRRESVQCERRDGGASCAVMAWFAHHDQQAVELRSTGQPRACPELAEGAAVPTRFLARLSTTRCALALTALSALTYTQEGVLRVDAPRLSQGSRRHVTLGARGG